jgi:hypothetical protein
VRNLHQDAIAAYALFQARFAATGLICTLGFSMGNAVMLDAYTEFHPAPACMIVGGAFSSGRDGAVRGWGIPEWMAHVLPDQWNNVTAISRSHPPLLGAQRCRSGQPALDGRAHLSGGTAAQTVSYPYTVFATTPHSGGP